MQITSYCGILQIAIFEFMLLYQKSIAGNGQQILLILRIAEKQTAMKRHLCILVLPLILIFPCGAQPWSGPTITRLGEEETVFSYVRDACVELDLPDVYAHPIRTAEGIVLGSGNAPDNYFMFGSNFESLNRSCTPVFRSVDAWEAEALKPHQWITSMYSEDGQTIYAIVHNEYHDPFAPNCKPGITDPSNPCWYNFLSLAVSTDAGRTFRQSTSPEHLVAILPYRWDSDAVERGAPPPHGYFEPSNIVYKEGYYYCMVFAILSNTNQGVRGTCLMRTDDISKANSWKWWDGQGFNIPLINPYEEEIGDPSQYLPAFIAPREIRDLRGSLTWNRYLEKYMLIGASVLPVDSQETCGFFYSLSDDLIHWTLPQLIYKTILGWPPCHRPTPEQASKNIRQEAYPSIIDHNSNDISFTVVDSTAFLYFMRNMDNFSGGGWGLRRDLIRVPLTFEKERSASTLVQGSNATFEWTLFPNPGADFLYINGNFSTETVRVSIFNAIGDCVMESKTLKIAHGSAQIDISTLFPGVYNFQLVDTTGRVYSKRISVFH
jgi:hypothetical protein